MVVVGGRETSVRVIRANRRVWKATVRTLRVWRVIGANQRVWRVIGGREMSVGFGCFDERRRQRSVAMRLNVGGIIC